MASDTMRIVHVVESLDVGGLEHVVLALAKLQRQHGHQVLVACLWRPGALAATAAAAGVEVQCAGKRAGFDLAALWRLRALLRRARPEVLHTHNPMAHYYAAAAALGLGVGTLLNTRHGMGSAQLNARTEWLYRTALRGSAFAVSVCSAAQRRFVAHGVMPGTKAVVVHNGIELARFTRSDRGASARIRAGLALPPGTVLFGSVGRLNEAKQQQLLLLALRALLDAAVPAALVIVGDGDQRAALEGECRRLNLGSAVHLLGARGDVPELLAAMDAFVLCSRTEGYSLALIEASAAGLPIIATDVGGNAEIVQHQRSGLLVPTADVGALTAAMAALAADASLRQRFAREAAQWAEREGSLDTMYERYLALYRQGAGLRQPHADDPPDVSMRPQA